MRTTGLRGRITLTSIAALLAAAAWGGRGGQALLPARVALAQEKAAAPKLTRQFVSAKQCSRCHTQPSEANKSELAQLTEYNTWKTEDQHSKAYERLLGRRSKRMGEILGRDVSKDAACLACHATGAGASAEEGSADVLAEGVSCVACHGAYVDWIEKHWVLGERWRALAAGEKEATYGLTDLRDTAKRTSVCISCHVGSLKEGKFVTHEMYAAGHPPLPSFEAATFSQSMPTHWWEPADVPYLKGKPPEVLARYHVVPGDLPQTKLAVTGGVAALRAAMAILDDAPRERAGEKDAEAAAPDFARFDCYACHHELRRQGWRPNRGFVGTPGRVPLPGWPETLVRLGIAATEPDAADMKRATGALDQDLATLFKANDARPYGDAAQVAAAAEAVRGRAAALLKSLTGSNDKPLFDRKAAIRLLGSLCKLAQEGTPDYDSARQLAWAFRVIVSEVEPPKAHSEGLRKALDELDRTLRLTLTESPQQPIDEQLTARMQALSSYDPVLFQKQFAELARWLPRE